MPAAEFSNLTLHFRFTFPGNIWKIKPDSLTQNLGLEIRQPELLQAAFYCLNTETGKMQMENFRPKERWWTGLEAAHNGLLLLHGYQAAKDTGRHEGLTAVSGTSGQIHWEDPTLTYAGLKSDQTLIAEDKTGQLLELDLLTGAQKKYSGTREHAKTEIHAFEINQAKGLALPVPYLPADTHYPLLQEFIRQKTGKEARQNIEYLETGTHILLSFYAETGSILANFLMVCSAQGELLLEICLQAEVAGLGSDTFFIFANKLIFIQEKTSLACYLL